MKHPAFLFSRLLGMKSPKVWYSNFHGEAHDQFGTRLPSIWNSTADLLARQMDIHQIFLADDYDYVLVKKMPDLDYLDYIKDRGIRIPVLISGEKEQLWRLFENRVAIPYMVDEREQIFLAANNCLRIGPSASLSVKLNNKGYTRQFCERYQFPVVERWHLQDYCLNTQILIWNEDVNILSVSAQHVNENGCIGGNNLHPSVPSDMLRLHLQEMQRLGSALMYAGYTGIVSVNSIVDPAGKQVPILDIHPRMTPVTYMLSIRHHLLQSGYPEIMLRSYDFQSKFRQSFSEFQEKLSWSVGHPVYETNPGYLIYGYHVAEDPVTGMFQYRIFILHWSKKAERLKTIIHCTEQMIEEMRCIAS